MANPLLDFVMSLVRDPDAAARYAQDPAGAIADAQLTDVTSADVQNLIPVVAESLSMSSMSSSMSSSIAAPAQHWDDLVPDPVSNVWASGAATAAFDAFDDQLPQRGVIEDDPAVPGIVDDVDPGFEVLTDVDPLDTATSLQVEAPVIDDILTAEAGLDDDWAQPIAPAETSDHGPSFDIFD